MAASTTTTIRGVSIYSRQRKRKTDVFDIALSPYGIAIQRPGRAEQHMTWERISEWEIEERPDCVVLTLRGGGSVTPLLVKGWTLEDLETVLRDATQADIDPEPEQEQEPVPVPVPVIAEAQPIPEVSRVERRQAAATRSNWKPLVTVVLLGVLAAAVVVVLLQSAGAISWSFLGPVA